MAAPTAPPTSSQAAIEPYPSPFPAASAHAAGAINGVDTAVTALSFADKLVLTVSQAGRLAHWVHVPLAAAAADPMNPGPMPGAGGGGGGAAAAAAYDDDNDDDDNDNDNGDGRGNNNQATALLPMSHLTATTVLGGTRRADEVLGQTLATTLASAVLVRRPAEQRLLVLGLGLEDAAGMAGDRAAFDELVGLILEVLG